MSDYVVNVSDACKQAFDAKHGYLTNKSIVWCFIDKIIHF